jgi:hypothetical protein
MINWFISFMSPHLIMQDTALTLFVVEHGLGLCLFLFFFFSGAGV